MRKLLIEYTLLSVLFFALLQFAIPRQNNVSTLSQKQDNPGSEITKAVINETDKSSTGITKHQFGSSKDTRIIVRKRRKRQDDNPTIPDADDIVKGPDGILPMHKEEKQRYKKLQMLGRSMDGGKAGNDNKQRKSSKNDDVFQFSFKYQLEDLAHPELQHFTLYQATFYPPWSYYGFHPPRRWHEVPIEYFSRPPAEQFDEQLLEKHKSSMNICSLKVTMDSAKCRETMENECINDLPSPIDILTEEATEDEDMDHFYFKLVDTFFGFTLFIPEDGTDLLFLTFMLPKKSVDKVPGVSGGSVGNNELFLDRILFHFGKDHLNGSEHAINGKRFGMEIQLFFTKDQGAYWESIAKYKFMKPHDFLFGHNMHIFSVMVSVGRPGAEAPEEKGATFSSRFEVISLGVIHFWKSQNANKSRAVQMNKKLLSLEDFLGIPSEGPYYTYEGSLSHPPCLKHAKWTVFENPIWITYEQWMRFASIHSEFSDEYFLGGNYRPMSEILIKADLPTYLEMREIEGLSKLDQKELDRISKFKPSNQSSNDSKPEYFVIQPYIQFKKYFAQRVRKRKRILEGNVSMDDDYYDDQPDEVAETSTAFIIHLSHFTRKVLFVNLVVLLKLMNFIVLS